MKNQFDDNLISDDGNHNPFVFFDTDGVHIGDCDNHEIYQTIDRAIEYAKNTRLGGGALSIARSHAKNDFRDNIAAEYHWHQDAGLQLDALMDFKKSRAKIATELMRDCPDESRADHQKIANAIKNCLSFDSICNTTDINEWPDTYHWVKTELGE